MLSSNTTNSDTIYAVSTGPGKAAVAVVRISGPQVDPILARLCGRTDFQDRKATLTRIHDGEGVLLDRGLLLRFLAPRSFSGEEMAELQITGSRAILNAVLESLSKFPRTRPAEAGEFAKRAFENGKLDLAEVEGLASVVEAETRAQLRQAMVLASGEFSLKCETVRELLLSAMATVESMLDFSDVDDASGLSISSIVPVVEQAVSTLTGMLDRNGISERLRDGMTVVIAGPPNAGKSTLLNYLAKRDVAIVSPFAGTTRDAIEVGVDLQGYPVTFIDTAGIRESSDPIETEGIARTLKSAARADLVIWLTDQEEVQSPKDLSGCPVISVRSKADIESGNRATPAVLTVSAVSGKGVDDLLSLVRAYADRHFTGVGSVVVGTARQQNAVREVLVELELVCQDMSRLPELVADDLRRAVDALGKVTGRIGTEQVLGEIFSRLCVGK